MDGVFDVLYMNHHPGEYHDNWKHKKDLHKNLSSTRGNKSHNYKRHTSDNSYDVSKNSPHTTLFTSLKSSLSSSMDVTYDISKHITNNTIEIVDDSMVKTNGME